MYIICSASIYPILQFKHSHIFAFLKSRTIFNQSESFCQRMLVGPLVELELAHIGWFLTGRPWYLVETISSEMGPSPPPETGWTRIL